jgi:hypothetical protein
MRHLPCIALCALVATGCAHSREHAHAGQAADTAFASMQARGKVAMGVDQYTSSHIFEPLSDGGRIVLQRDPPDTAGTGAIRAHLDSISKAFSAGDFSIPGFVHDQVVPGTAVMAAHRDQISYAMDTLPRGGEVRIQSTDSAAVAAIHEFLSFQREAHHAMGHDMAHGDSE